ncbi:thioesterase family protein [Aeromicrobium sp. UC242_57]|uniref:thioesterase family protein n=1 Tax=Aeromicrobium sp. UC242_57 TaxID=3374624 RepID=UPI0037988C75
MNQTPAYAHVVALPQTWSTRVPAEFIDENGHMTVGQYAVLGGHGTASLLEAVGVDDHYRSARRMGFFVAEQHVTLSTEILQGSSVSMHPRVIGRTTTTLHLISLPGEPINPAGIQLAGRDAHSCGSRHAAIPSHVGADRPQSRRSRQ